MNVLLFFGLIWLAVGQFSGWVDTFMPSLPNWLAFLEYLLWPLFVALVVLMVFFTFTMLANIIAAPFNGFLREGRGGGTRRRRRTALQLGRAACHAAPHHRP